MKLIVGLGNPGDAYAHTRHNIGFLGVEALARRQSIFFKKERGTFSFCASGAVGRQHLVLAKPLTFMNLSGVAVKALLKKYRLPLSGLLVICDDLDLGFGRMKIKPGGSSGGHRGLQSIGDTVGSAEFARLRIGIDRSFFKDDASGYVLAPFNARQRQELGKIFECVCDCCEAWVTMGITQAMNLYNKRSARSGVD